MTHQERFILYVLLATSLMDGVNKDTNAVLAVFLLAGSVFAMLYAWGEALKAFRKEFLDSQPNESEAPDAK